MRLPTLEALRTSKVYKSLPSLAKMPVFRQKRFLEIFNRIFDLATRRGATEDVAEANASAIAVMAAERYTPTPATAQLEDEEHYFATLAEYQYSIGGKVEVNDFSFVLANLDLVNAAVEGNAFNLNHDHTEPTGVVRRIVKPADAPAHIRAKHPDAPFFTVASYYQDTPEELRAITAISAEWLQAKPSADGSQAVILPDSFALALTDPATPEVLGVGKVAGLEGSGNGYEGHDAVEGSEDTMPPTVQELEAKVASLQKEASASQENATKAREFETKLATLEGQHKALAQKHDALLSKVASLAGKEPVPGQLPDEKTALGGLESRIATLATEVETLKADAKKAEANLWADKVLREREFPTDAKPKLASLYLTAKQAALDLETSLPQRINKPGDAKAVLNLDQLEGDAAKVALNHLKGAF